MEFPMNGEMLNLIDCTVKKAVEQTVSELKRQNMIAEGRQTPFQKTETLLYNYNSFQAVIKEKEEQIAELKAFGMRKKSTSISSFSGGSGFVESKSDAEKVEEKIDAIEFSIHTTRNFIKVIDEALATLQGDPYYDLIAMKYFEGRTQEELSEHFECDVRTIRRNKNRLINQLQIRLFSDEVIQHIFAG